MRQTPFANTFKVSDEQQARVEILLVEDRKIALLLPSGTISRYTGRDWPRGRFKRPNTHRNVRKILGFRVFLGIRKVLGLRKVLRMRQIHGGRVNEEPL